VVALTAGVKAMNTKSFFSVVLVALVASHGEWALADGNELCGENGTAWGPGISEQELVVGPPGILECAVDDPLCSENGGAIPAGIDSAIVSAASRIGGPPDDPSIAECLVQGTEPPPPPPAPASGDPSGDASGGKSLDGQHYVEYTLDAAGGWTGYRATIDLAAGAAGTFVSLDFRGADGQVSEVRIALVTDASGARWAVATGVGVPEIGAALVPVLDDQLTLSLRFAPGSLGLVIDGQAASLALPSGSAIEVVRVGHFAVDATAAPVVAITSPRFTRVAH
jgi:hypothetical protein